MKTKSFLRTLFSVFVFFGFMSVAQAAGKVISCENRHDNGTYGWLTVEYSAEEIAYFSKGKKKDLKHFNMLIKCSKEPVKLWVTQIVLKSNSF